MNSRLDPIAWAMALMGYVAVTTAAVVSISPRPSAVFFVIAMGLCIVVGLTVSRPWAVACGILLGILFAAVQVASALGDIATGAFWISPFDDPYLNHLGTWSPAIIGATGLVIAAALTGWVGAGLVRRRESARSFMEPAFPTGPGAIQRLAVEIDRAQRSRRASLLARIALVTNASEPGGAPKAGDAAAARTGGTIRRHLRPEDLVVQESGGTLLALLPDTTERQGRAVLRRLERAASTESACTLSTQLLGLPAREDAIRHLVPDLDATSILAGGEPRPKGAEEREPKMRARSLRALD